VSNFFASLGEEDGGEGESDLVHSRLHPPRSREKGTKKSSPSRRTGIVFTPTIATQWYFRQFMNKTLIGLNHMVWNIEGKNEKAGFNLGILPNHCSKE
jgi:hypothetical protein